jgi:hypothetical protein
MVMWGFAFQQKEKAIASEKKAAAARDAAKEAETKTGQIASHSEYLRGCELIASGNEDRALKSFAQALHSSPDNREAATRLISLLGQRSWPRLIAPPLHLANRVECLAATPDGRHLFVATDQPRSGDAYSMSAVQAYDLGSLKLMVKPKIDPEDAIEAPIGKRVSWNPNDMNGEHLSPKTRELLDKPIEERIAHIQKDSFFAIRSGHDQNTHPGTGERRGGNYYDFREHSLKYDPDESRIRRAIFPRWLTASLRGALSPLAASKTPAAHADPERCAAIYRWAWKQNITVLVR